jgi:hypothetical protein
VLLDVGHAAIFSNCSATGRRLKDCAARRPREPLQQPDRDPTDGDRPRFLEQRPSDLREAAPWHRYAHHIRTLPARLEALAPGLQVKGGDRVLDLGCADVPYRGFFPVDAEYVAADLAGNPHATLTLNPDGSVPCPDQSFDATFVYHPDPVDLWRWTCAGLRLAVEREGFEVVEFEGIIGPIASGLQIIQDVTYYRLPRLLRPLYALAIQTLARISDRFERRIWKDLNGSVFALIAQRPQA